MERWAGNDTSAVFRRTQSVCDPTLTRTQDQTPTRDPTPTRAHRDAQSHLTTRRRLVVRCVRQDVRLGTIAKSTPCPRGEMYSGDSRKSGCEKAFSSGCPWFNLFLESLVPYHVVCLLGVDISPTLSGRPDLDPPLRLFSFP